MPIFDPTLTQLSLNKHKTKVWDVLFVATSLLNSKEGINQNSDQ